MTKIIAEIGWNHIGDIDLAKTMINAAKKNGTDFVKTQFFDVKYLKKGPWDSDGRRSIYEKAALTDDKYIELKKYAEEININFFTSVFNIESAQKISRIDQKIIKIPSVEARNYKLLDYACDNFNEVLISTGTLFEKEINNLALRYKNFNISLLHCVSVYPCPVERVNLPKILYLKNLIPNVGFSDHSIGIEASVLSLPYNPNYIEKHFTTDNNLPGRDNKFAILPETLRELKKYIDIYSKAKIYHGNNFQECEREVREIYAGRWG